ncbi:MAG: TonB-dependent receptor domain-containing protein, partial [Gammaproteobacteria bacterium]
DSGVEANVNEVPILYPRLFETEFYDVQQIAVLRGPQGPLFGRNSTGGAINMITNPADPSELGGYVEGEYGDYSHTQAEGAINIPLGDTLAVRFAGVTLQRDGYTENVAPGGDDIDDRDQYSVRGSIRWLPSENTTIDLMASWFEEDSSRTRSQKQMCHNDPSGVLGCLPDRLEFEMVNPLAQLTGLLPSRLSILGPTPGLVNNPAGNPDDLRKTALDFEPTYESDETLVTFRLSHEFEKHTATFVAGYQDTSVYSKQDYTMSLGQAAGPSPFLAFITPVARAAFFADGCMPISAPSASGTGVVGGNRGGCSNSLDAYDQSNQETDQRTYEARIQSNYEGDFNFMLGAFHMDAETFNEYWVIATGLDYFALVFPEIPRGLGGLGLPGQALVAPNYVNRTNSYELESNAVFGEAYFQLNDELKLTAGIRYTIDRKDIDDIQYLFNQYSLNGATTFVTAPFGFNDTIPNVAPRKDDEEWKEATGRVVLDWSPDLAMTDSTLFYASYSRGYKGGGFNPPFDPALFPNTAQTFDPEYINAFELGTKNILLDGTLQANLSAFFYDYEGLQVSKIINRTSFNENTDAEIYGLEAEFVYAPTEQLQLNANVSYLHTEIKDLRSVDARDPTGGRSDVTLIKDNLNASNCVINHNGAPAPTLPPNGPADDRVQSCAGLAATLPAPYTVNEGVPADLAGNELINSPELTVSLGAQYTFLLPASYSLVARVDYYWQDQMYGRIFNQPIDEIESWDVWNAQATLNSPDQSWFLRAFVKNIADEDNVVGMYVTDPSSGLFTNLFLIEPRTYGLAAGYRF